MSIWLWGYLDFDNLELDVIPVDRGVKAVRKGTSGNSREWEITASASIRTRLEARTKSGAVWDWVDLTFMAVQAPTQTGSIVRPEDRAAVIAAVRDGRIQGATDQLSAIDKHGHFDDGRHHNIVLADGMFPVLAELAAGGPLTLLSLMRFDQGPHGKVFGADVAVCSAMDIKVYAGIPINLLNGQNVDNAIAGVERIIANLPPGLYAIGLPRPSPFPMGPPMPDKDVFLPCDGKIWPMYRPGRPLNNPTPEFVNPVAATTINNALRQNPRARMNRMFEDGPDHLHLEVISASRV
jgi:hypothetical protein